MVPAWAWLFACSFENRCWSFCLLVLQQHKQPDVNSSEKYGAASVLLLLNGITLPPAAKSLKQMCINYKKVFE